MNRIFTILIFIISTSSFAGNCTQTEALYSMIDTFTNEAEPGLNSEEETDYSITIILEEALSSKLKRSREDNQMISVQFPYDTAKGCLSFHFQYSCLTDETAMETSSCTAEDKEKLLRL